VVVRLDFKECVPGSTRRIKPRVSRCLLSKTSLNDTTLRSNSPDIRNLSELESPDSSLLKSPSSPKSTGVATPQSPIINRRRRIRKEKIVNSPHDMAPLPESVVLPCPKSPVICSNKKQRHSRSLTYTDESQSPTSKPLSPILSKSTCRRSSIKRTPLSPILSKQKRRQLLPANSTKINLNDYFVASDSQHIIEMQSQTQLAPAVVDCNPELETCSQQVIHEDTQHIFKSSIIEDSSQEVSTSYPCTQQINPALTTHINLGDRMRSLRNSFTVSRSRRTGVVQKWLAKCSTSQDSNQEAIIDDSIDSSQEYSGPPSIDVPSSPDPTSAIHNTMVCISHHNIAFVLKCPVN
jgi:hypothetical protein